MIAELLFDFLFLRLSSMEVRQTVPTSAWAEKSIVDNFRPICSGYKKRDYVQIVHLNL
jgi:hypothetical protein